MTNHETDLGKQPLPKLSRAASLMGYEIVDVAGVFDSIVANTKQQSSALEQLKNNAQTVETSAKKVSTSGSEMRSSAEEANNLVTDTVARIRESSGSAKDMAAWVQDLSGRTESVNNTLKAVGKNNQQIVAIARQVNTLAINAKIEAARAGEAGRGFSVVADAINDLSQQTSSAAVQISENVTQLTEWILSLAQEAQQASEKAVSILDLASHNDKIMAEMENAIQASRRNAVDIEEQSQRMQSAIGQFAPSLESIAKAANETTESAQNAHARIDNLIDTSESIVQNVAALGGTGDDASFIAYVQSAAFEISGLFDEAVATGRVNLDDLFDQTYTPIPGTDPEQVLTRFTELTDQLLPPIQEKALEFDPKVVFCAAVDRNGYLPTHNLKFSKPQGEDPVWNTANCRNRRIFNDRVGLKAGGNTEPFLVQVYRRDMGGGEFVMMKDISAPIFINGRHWGGLRFAVKF